ncbi:MAG: nucleoid-structuring protein H-NS [Cyclobacteriaceae bacterium]|nr:nucleoid-structuring protein H-NS [Cyclobacteriaceae bacterium]
MKSNQPLVYLIILLTASVMIFGCKSSKKVASATTEPAAEVKEAPTATEKPAETVKTTVPERTVEQKLEGYFDEIAGARDINLANRNISEVLSYFATKDAPVFIVFYREGGQKDYDKPTDIAKHLNYLKDQKKNPYKIDKVIYNDQGKIEELELTTR